MGLPKQSNEGCTTETEGISGSPQPCLCYPRSCVRSTMALVADSTALLS